jgi:hypothetical protein
MAFDQKAETPERPRTLYDSDDRDTASHTEDTVVVLRRSGRLIQNSTP